MPLAGEARLAVASLDMDVVRRRRRERAFQHPHQVVAGVRDDDVAVGPNRHPHRGRQLRQDRRAIIAKLVGFAGAGDGVEHVVGGREFAHLVVAGVRDVQVRPGVESDARGEAQLRRGADHSIDGTRGPRACHGLHRAVGQIQPPDHIVIGIRDVEAVAVDGQGARMVQGRGQHRGDRAGAADRAHAIIQRVRHKDDVALGIPGDAVGGVELRGGRRTVIALEAERPGAGNRADHRGLHGARAADRGNRDAHLANLVTEGVGDIDVEARHLVAGLRHLPDRDRVRSRQLRLRRIAAVTFDGERARARKAQLTVVDQQANHVVGRVGDEGVAAGHRQAKGLLGDLGRLSHG